MVTEANRKVLWAESGNCCAICHVPLTAEATDLDPAVPIGEEGHIVSASPKGPRYRPLGEVDPEDPENLVVLCPNHHTLIDKQTSTYTEEQVREIKLTHKKWVRDAIARAEGRALYSSGPGDLVVGVVREIPHWLDIGLLVLEVRVTLHNTTDSPKSVDVLSLSASMGEVVSVPSADELRLSIETLRLQSPLLTHQTLIEPGERVAGWVHFYFGTAGLSGTPSYEIRAVDEKGTDYRVTVPHH